MMKDEDTYVKIARIEEGLKIINSMLIEYKDLIKELQEDNIKKHDEIRDCYYLSEMSRKRFEEQYEVLESKLEDVVSKYANICTTCKLLHTENDTDHKAFTEKFSVLQTAQSKRIVELSKTAIYILIAIIIALLGDISGLTGLLRAWF
jgi:hypothetical protein